MSAMNTKGQNVPKGQKTPLRKCTGCGEMKPKKDGICDDCNVELTQRADDTEETFVKRFDEYMQKTMPLYDYYDNKGVLKKIKAYESKQDTFNEALKVLEQ